MIRNRVLTFPKIFTVGLKHARYSISHTGFKTNRQLPLVGFYRPVVTLKAIAAFITGVPLMVYSYKCLMMVLFQSKLIYMSYLPFGARDPELWKDTFKAYKRNHPKGWKFEPYLLEFQSDLNAFSWLGIFKKVVLRGFLLENNPSSHSNHPKEPEVNVIYFQGNGGNMYHRKELFEGLLKQGDSLGIKLRVVAVHLRGYGDSSGTSSQRRLMEDSRKIFEGIKLRHPSSRTIIYGHSLGGAVAIHLACDYLNLIDGLVLENTFTSIHGMVVSMYPAWLPYRYLTRSFLMSPWDSLFRIQSLKPPIPWQSLLLASKMDDVVPHDMMLELHKSLTNLSDLADSSRSKLELVCFPYGLHDNAYWQPGFWKAWRLLLKEIGR